jgi:hypothetical protein
MITRTSKIARLPIAIREQLNRRLEGGEIGRTILPWLNSLPETKRVLAELFGGKPVTHQNLSEWRLGGYQDWLFLQQRLQWFEQLGEQETELVKRECADAHEAMGSFLLFEIGQALTALRGIKNPEKHWERLEKLTREFARLQNAYNWSRHVHLEWKKHNAKISSNPPPEPIQEFEEEDNEEYYQDEDEDNTGETKTPETDANDIVCSSAFTRSAADQKAQLPPTAGTTPPSPPQSGGEGRGEVALRAQGETVSPAPTPGAPASRRLPGPYELYAENPNVKPPFAPIPPLAPPTPPRPYPKNYSLRAILGRRFKYIEG